MKDLEKELTKIDKFVEQLNERVETPHIRKIKRDLAKKREVLINQTPVTK